MFKNSAPFCSTSIHPDVVPISLELPPDKPSLIWLVSSHKPEQASPTMFPNQLCWFFATKSILGRGDCIVGTSQPCER